MDGDVIGFTLIRHLHNCVNSPLDKSTLMRHIPDEITIPEFSETRVNTEFDIADSLAVYTTQGEVSSKFDSNAPLRIIIPIDIGSNVNDIDFKEDLLEEINEILSSDESYHLLTDQQKDLIHECVGLPRETMEFFANAGSSISESIEKISSACKVSAEMIESESAKPMDAAMSSQNEPSGLIPSPSELPFYFANGANDGINYSSGALVP